MFYCNRSDIAEPPSTTAKNDVAAAQKTLNSAYAKRACEVSQL